jgi:hypothetical protein
MNDQDLLDQLARSIEWTDLTADPAAHIARGRSRLRAWAQESPWWRPPRSQSPVSMADGRSCSLTSGPSLYFQVAEKGAYGPVPADTKPRLSGGHHTDRGRAQRHTGRTDRRRHRSGGQAAELLIAR